MYPVPVLIDSVDKAVLRHGLSGRRILVAVSGGVDSSVLLHALSELIQKRNLVLSVGHVQHGLRGQASIEDQEAVLTQARTLGLNAQVLPGDPHPERTDVPNQARPTLQEAAREVRLKALNEMARLWKADHLATGHNLDDQSETILMRLLRGTGPMGMQGIEHQSKDGFVVRPLLSVSREEILDFAQERQIVWREDASNATDQYTRNKLRHHWIPQLREAFNPQLLTAIGRFADAMQEDERWIGPMVREASDRMTLASETHSTAGLTWTTLGWEELPDGLALRVIRQGLHDAGRGRDVSRIHLERILAFLRKPDVETGRRIELPGGDSLVKTPSGYRFAIGGRDQFSPC